MVMLAYEPSTWEAKAREATSQTEASLATETDLFSKHHKHNSKNSVRLRTKQGLGIRQGQAQSFPCGLETPSLIYIL